MPPEQEQDEELEDVLAELRARMAVLERRVAEVENKAITP
jgi:hypothetical protein